VIAVLKNAYNPAGASLSADREATNSLRSMPHVASRIARASYGAVFGFAVRDAVPPVNPAKETPYEDDEGTKRVRRVEWYLKKVRPCMTAAHGYAGSDNQSPGRVRPRQRPGHPPLLPQVCRTKRQDSHVNPPDKRCRYAVELARQFGPGALQDPLRH